VSKTACVLSKSRLKRGLQCSKSLYYTLHRKELEAPIDEATQQNFDDGNEIGELAQKEFPGGVLIDNAPWDREGAVKATERAIQDGATVIYEASFLANNLYARVDILKRKSKDSAWEVIEVKKGSKIKDEYIEDVAIQALILKEAKVKVSGHYIMHLNPECVNPNLDNLFTTRDVSDEVQELLPMLKDRIADLHKVVSAAKEPKIEIGPHCSAPYECSFKAHCWKKFPSLSVFNLPGVGEVKGWQLISEGKLRIQDLEAAEFNGNARRAIEVTQSGKRWVEPEGILEAVEQWQWPLYFLDFETLMPAIPRYHGCTPYTQVPFQISCHVWKSPKHKLEHFEYLHLDSSDPRPPIAKVLAEKIGAKGSVIAYNAGFEKRVLEKLAKDVPKHAKSLKAIVERLVDPLPVMRKHVYDPQFFGSFSIKNVAPALLGKNLGYENLDVGDGMLAQTLAEQIIRSKVSGDKAREIREALLEYCRQDTMAMVELAKWMMKTGRTA